MPVTYAEDVPRVNYSRYAAPAPEETQSVLGAAFRLENDVLNLINYASRPMFQPDPAFDPRERVKTSPFFANNPDPFIGIESDQEWDWMESKLAQEYKDRATLQAAGIGGIAAAMTAGILSPTILLPAGAAAKSATVAGGAARAAGWTAFSVGVQEGVLHLNQDTRTVQESAFAIGSGAVLGGILGGGVRYLDPLDMDRVAQSMVDRPGEQAISPLVSPPSAAQPRGLSAEAAGEDAPAYAAGVDPGGIADNLLSPIAKRFGVENILNMQWLGPVTRGLASEFAARRSMTAQFSNAGLATQVGEATAEGGVLEQLVKQYPAKYAQANQQVQQLYKQWYQNSGGRAGRLGARLSVSSQKEFASLVGQALFARVQGGRFNVDEAAKAADVYYDTVFLPIIKEAQYAGLPPFGRLSDEYALQMVTQKISRMKAAEDYQAIRQIIYENALERLRESKLKAEKLDLESESTISSILKTRAPRGVSDTGEGAGKFDLAGIGDDELDGIADVIADELMARHLSNGLRHGAIDILQNIGEKEAKFVYIDPTRAWSNGRTWGEFLEQDIEILARSFVRSMGPDIELYRRFKVNFRSGKDFKLTDKAVRKIPQVGQFLEETKAAREAAAELPEKQRIKRNKQIDAEERAFENDMNVMIGRLRHTYGMPQDPTAVGHRLGKAALQLNTMRLMGSVVISSLPDIARFVMKYGFMSTMRDGLIPMLREFKNFKLLAKEAQYAGEALDVLMHARSTAMADLFEEMDYAGNFLERAMTFGTSRIGIVGLFDYWNTNLKLFASAVLNSELSRAMEAAKAGSLSAKQKRMLAQLNITERQAKQIFDLMDKQGGGTRTASGVLLPNTEDWLNLTDEVIESRANQLLRAELRSKPKSPKKVEDFMGEARSELLKERQALLRSYRAAVAQGVSDTIVTPGLERANWVDASTLGRLIGQFRSFTLSSTFKVALAASQEARAGNMAPIMAGVTFSLAMGTVSYYTWAMSVGGRTKERMLNELEDALNGDEQAMARWADEAISRSGLTGVLAEAQKFAERTPGLAPYATVAGQAPTRSPYLNPAMELMGPWLGAVENMGRIAVTADDPTSETFRAAKQLMPYQNLFYMRYFFDRMNERAMDAAGVSYR